MERQEMQELSRLSELKRSKLIGGIVSIVLGLVLLFWPGLSMVLISRMIGSAILISGVFNVIIYFTTGEKNSFTTFILILGIILSIAGAYIFIRPLSLVAFIPIFMGVVMLMSGCIGFMDSFSLLHEGYDKWWITLLFSILKILCGIVIIMRPFGVASMIITLMGAILVFNGVSDLWTVSRISKVIKDVN